MLLRMGGAKPRRVTLEVCVDRLEDAVAAAAAGADRIELNAALELDGLTPPVALLTEVRRAVRVPVVAMARPRPGDFCYTPAEFDTLLRAVDQALEHGADSVAFGVLTEGGEVDVARCGDVVRAVARAGRPVEAVFHRAFDATAGDPHTALEQLIDLGVRRVMTSGRRPTAIEGAALLAELVRRAAGRIEILPAGGVRAANAIDLLRQTGCDQLHTSARGTNGRFSAPELGELVKQLTARRDT
jgi:copper homeostasis protein